MNAHVIPLAVPDIGPAEKAKAIEAIESGWVSSVGPAVTELEEKVAAASGTEAAAVVSSGTAALHLALVAAGVGHGDLVITASYTFIATANAISNAGALPLFLDVSRDGWTMDPDALEAVLRDECLVEGEHLEHRRTGRRVAAVMPVFTMGTPADMDRIREIAGRYGLIVIADAAAAIGSTYKGRPAGLTADLVCYSFNGNKTITSGAGGAVTGRADLVKLVKHLSTTARVGANYDHDRVGFNYRMSNVNAAIGCAQIDRLPEFIASKARTREFYRSRFEGIAGIEPCFPVPGWAESANWFSGIRLLPESGWTVPDLVRELNAKGIMVRLFWKPMHHQAPYLHAPRGPMEVTDEIWEGILPLPCSTSIRQDQLGFVAETLAGLLGSRS